MQPPVILFHQHRIIPGHMGGTYDPKNVIRRMKEMRRQQKAVQ
jgi:hypothetical protein